MPLPRSEVPTCSAWATPLGVVQRATQQFLEDGRYDAMFETSADYRTINELFR